MADTSAIVGCSCEPLFLASAISGPLALYHDVSFHIDFTWILHDFTAPSKRSHKENVNANRFKKTPHEGHGSSAPPRSRTQLANWESSNAAQIVSELCSSKGSQLYRNDSSKHIQPDMVKYVREFHRTSHY
jgi:hypothetical protein